MEKKLSVISFDIIPESERKTSGRYALTNSLAPHSPYLSYEHPFLLKGMIFGLHLRGTSRLRIDLREYSLRPNTVFTILPNQIFESLENSEDSFVEILFFSVDFMNNLPLPKNFGILNNMKRQPCLDVLEENMQEIMEYHSFIVKSCNQPKTAHRKEIDETLLCALIGLIASLYAEEKTDAEQKITSRGEEIVNRFSDLLARHYRSERNAAFYADKMCITPQYLSRTLKELTGRPVSTWISEAVILEAKALLKSSDMSVIQISEELNFPNPSFFCRFFKQYTSLTPLKYKNG